jgi:hypothetical protein
MPIHGRAKLVALPRNLWPLIVAHALIDYRWIV